MDEYRKLLPAYIANQSVSTDPAYKGGIASMVAWLKSLFEEHGFKVAIVEGYGNPVVVAHYVADPNLQTCLIYGHYDVQPASSQAGWESDPFTVVEREGRIFCRGAIDNKGQNLIHIVSVFDLIKDGKLGYNIKFMIEGDEETGSPELPKLLADNKELLKADFAMISDGEIGGETPMIEVGFRGGFNLTLTVTTSNTDLHSGLYGGASPSSAHELVNLLAKIYDDKWHVTVPDFYEGVDEITPEMLANDAKIPFSKEEYEHISGTKALLMEDGYDFYTQTGLRPSIQVTGIETGYNGEGYRNSIPAKATAKINFRLVLHQEPEKVAAAFEAWVKQQLPPYATATVEMTDPYNGIKLEVNNPFVEKAVRKLKQAFGKDPVYKYDGGGLPIVTLYHDVLDMPTVPVPLANEDCKMHAANENFNLEYVEKGLAFSHAFFAKEQ